MMSDATDMLRDRLLEQRIVLLISPIDDATAQLLIAQLLYLEAEESTAPVSLYINSTGGAIPATFAILDTCETLRPAVSTTCIGRAAGGAALILASGTRSQRSATPEARIELVPVRLNTSVPHSNIRLHADEVIRFRDLVASRFAGVTGRAQADIEADMKKSLSLSAVEAMHYGLIDRIVDSRQVQLR